MGKADTFTDEKLVVGLLWSPEVEHAAIISPLTELFGEIDHNTEIIDFSFTDYYQREMGSGLRRQLVSFRHLTAPDQLWKIKDMTNGLEDRFTLPGDNRPRRQVNIDPGILAMNRFCLATTKDNAHRIPLRNGYFAELTLMYENGDYHPLPWSYPDYSSDWARGFLKKVRETYKAQLRERRTSV